MKRFAIAALVCGLLLITLPKVQLAESTAGAQQPLQTSETRDDDDSDERDVASVIKAGYRVRRLSDGSLLPGYTTRSDLRTIDFRDNRPRSPGDTIDL